MVSTDSLKRALRYGIWNLLTSVYLWAPVVFTLAIYSAFPSWFTRMGMRNFVNSSTNVSISIIPITLTGLAILISFTDREFLSYFSKNGEFDSLLFIFEYTIIIAGVSAVYGVVLQSVEFEKWVFGIYLFAFLHLMASVGALVSTILRFATTKARYRWINDLNRDELPQELLDDIDRINKKNQTEEDQESE